ncbi:MAG TPA: VOC family protein [Chloroflexota bacterium]|nr:VOC family protein [Chloroflexota bacterium]
MVKVKGLFHATLPVYDLERAETFYREMLGIQRHAIPSYFPETVVFLDLGNTMLHLVRYKDEYSRGDYQAHHLAIEVDDLDAARAKLQAAGVRILNEIVQRPDMRCFNFLDTEGNRVELTQH